MNPVEVSSRLRVVEWTDGAAWDAFLDGHPLSTIAHRWAWREIIGGAYRHRMISLAAVDGATLRGVLPLALVSGRILGRYLVSMPFLDYGGACAAGGDAERALVATAAAIAHEENAVLELRCSDPRPLDLSCSLDKATMLLPLGDDEDAVWDRLSSERRNRIRKGRKAGLKAGIHGPEALDDFFKVFAANMRDLGSPVHSRSFFSRAAAELDGRLRVVVVRDGASPIGAGIMLLDGDTIAIPWVSSLREAFPKCPNQTLYWEAIRFGIAAGFRTLDFGRSSKDSGTFEAKRQWGAEPRQLHWYFSPGDARPPAGDVHRFSWVSRVWRRLPLAVTNAAGPRLRRSIPN